MKQQFLLCIIYILLLCLLGCSSTTLVEVNKLELRSLKDDNPSEIFVTTTNSIQYHFNKNEYYIENDTLYGQGKIYLNDKNKNFEGKIALSNIESIYSGLIIREKEAENEIDNTILQSAEDENIDYSNYRNNDVGAELTLITSNGNTIHGELLSVRVKTIIISKKYARREKELSNNINSIYSIKNKNIKEIIIEGDSRFWEGVGFGAIAGAVIGAGYGSVKDDEGTSPQEGATCFTPIGAIIGGIVGFNIYDMIHIKFPSNYDFTSFDSSSRILMNSLLSKLARYSEKEPTYLKAIN